MKILSIEPDTAIIKDRGIRSSGDFRSSIFFLKTREAGNLKLVDLGRAENVHEAIRIAKEKGFEPTHYIQVEGNKRITTPLHEIGKPGLPKRPMRVGMAA